MIILLPYRRVSANNLVRYNRKQLIVDKTTDYYSYSAVLNTPPNSWYHTMDMGGTTFLTAEEAMTDLDRLLKNLGYILCDTEEQVAHYKLLI